MKKLSRGFTLVEVMIVVAIIALLAAIAIPNLLRAKVNANEATAKGSLKLVSNALENFYAINNVYPSATTQLLGVTPPYLIVDYFTAPHNGYNYAIMLSSYTYSVTATPISASQGTKSFTMSTAGILVEN